MNRSIALALFSLVALGAGALAAPQIGVVDGPSYDFGTIPAGTLITHDFILTNAGDATLEISQVQAACGCTTTTLDKMSLEPGESVALTAQFNSTGFRSAVDKPIYVKSNDPVTPTFLLHLVGIVQSLLQPYHIPVDELNYLYYLLIDLRTPEAYAASHLFGALNIPFAELGQWLDRLPKEGVLIIFYDQDGSLSDQAAQAWQNLGYVEAKSLFGGLDEWMKAYESKYLLDPTP
jgi:rhodanese-related sulfurtransferase